MGEDLVELRELLCRRQLAEQQQIRDLFIAECARLLMRIDDVLDAEFESADGQN